MRALLLAALVSLPAFAGEKAKKPAKVEKTKKPTAPPKCSVLGKDGAIHEVKCK